MEKTIILNKNEQVSHSSNIILNNRKTLNLSGVDEVISSNESSIYLKVSGTKLQILGSNITKGIKQSFTYLSPIPLFK